MNIFAHTDAGCDYPAYISINRDDKGAHTISVRSQGNGGRDCATIAVTPELLESMATALMAHLQNGAAT